MRVNQKPEEPIDISIVPVSIILPLFLIVCGGMMCLGVDASINCAVMCIFIVLGVTSFLLLKIRYKKLYKKYEEDLEKYQRGNVVMYPSSPVPRPINPNPRPAPVKATPRNYEEVQNDDVDEEMERINEEILELQEEEDEERRRQEEDYWINGPGNEYYSNVTHQVEDSSYFDNHPDENRDRYY